MYPRHSLELEEEEESLLHPQTAAATAGAEVHWDEESTDGEEPEEELEGEDYVELNGKSGLCRAMTGDATPLIGEQDVRLGG